MQMNLTQLWCLCLKHGSLCFFRWLHFSWCEYARSKAKPICINLNSFSYYIRVLKMYAVAVYKYMQHYACCLKLKTRTKNEERKKNNENYLPFMKMKRNTKICKLPFRTIFTPSFFLFSLNLITMYIFTILLSRRLSLSTNFTPLTNYTSNEAQIYDNFVLVWKSTKHTRMKIEFPKFSYAFRYMIMRVDSEWLPKSTI